MVQFNNYNKEYKSMQNTMTFMIGAHLSNNIILQC